MVNLSKAEWVLRVGLFFLFITHGVSSLGGNEEWIEWIMNATSWDAVLAGKALFLLGVLDIVTGVLLLVKPLRIVVLWAGLWTSWTAIMVVLPFIGESVGEVTEKLINPAAAFALLYIRGVPNTLKGWLS